MMYVDKIRMLRWMCIHTRGDRNSTEDIQNKMGITPIVDTMRGATLRWFEHMIR